MFGRRREEELHEFIREEREGLRDLIRQERDELRGYIRKETENSREFMREILLRNEKVYTAVIAEIHDMREQIQANTRAVLSVLDRLEGSNGAT